MILKVDNTEAVYMDSMLETRKFHIHEKFGFPKV